LSTQQTTCVFRLTGFGGVTTSDLGTATSHRESSIVRSNAFGSGISSLMDPTSVTIGQTSWVFLTAASCLAVEKILHYLRTPLLSLLQLSTPGDHRGIIRADTCRLPTEQT
jgi:hypothetical protein